MSKREQIIVSPKEIKRQQNIIEDFKIYNGGKNKKYILTTYGCQMNTVRCILPLF